MYRTLDDFEGRYDVVHDVVPPGEGVSLATLGVMPYSPPDPAWEDDDRMPAAPDMEAPGISFADLVRTITLQWSRESGATTIACRSGVRTTRVRLRVPRSTSTSGRSIRASIRTFGANTASDRD